MSEHSLRIVMDDSESARRTQIVTATRKLIEDRGIAQITTKQIAKAAGCAEGTIFRHFARKEDLLLAAVMASFPSLRESLISISGGTPREPLHRVGAGARRGSCRLVVRAYFVRVARPVLLPCVHASFPRKKRPGNNRRRIRRGPCRHPLGWPASPGRHACQPQPCQGRDKTARQQGRQMKRRT